MHAARALNAQRKRRDEKLQAQKRRQSAVSARSASRSPVPSVDLEANKRKKQKSNGVDCAYVGFIIAIFGAVPLLVGTFISVPALWEVGLGLTLIGLFIGISFWCCDFCVRQATKDYEEQQGGDPRSRRARGGKVEDISSIKPLENSFKNGRPGSAHSLRSVKSGSGSLSTPTKGHVRKSPEVHLETVSEVENPNLRHGSSKSRQFPRVVAVVPPEENEPQQTNLIMVNSESSPSSVPLAETDANLKDNNLLSPVDDLESTLSFIEGPSPSPSEKDETQVEDDPQPVEGPLTDQNAEPEVQSDPTPPEPDTTESAAEDAVDNNPPGEGEEGQDDTRENLQNSDEINKVESGEVPEETMDLDEAIAEIESATDPNPTTEESKDGDSSNANPADVEEAQKSDEEISAEKAKADEADDTKEAQEDQPESKDKKSEMSDEKLGDEISKILESATDSVKNEEPEVKIGI